MIGNELWEVCGMVVMRENVLKDRVIRIDDIHIRRWEYMRVCISYNNIMGGVRLPRSLLCKKVWSEVLWSD